MSMYYDPMGNPIPMEKWAAAFQKVERHVGETVLRLHGNWYRVSTVWLGLNHNWNPSGPPLIYETMIFAEKTGMEDLAMWRYSTGEQAIRGHVRAVRWLKRNVRETPRPKPLIHNGHKPVGRPTKRK